MSDDRESISEPVEPDRPVNGPDPDPGSVDWDSFHTH